MNSEGTPKPGMGDLPQDRTFDADTPTQVDQSAQASLGRTVAIPGFGNLEPLHQGGQGVVYRAWQESTKRVVAIKVLSGGAYATDAAKKRFQREIEIVAQLRHPNIVAIFDSGQTPEGLPFYVMEHVDGKRLDHHVREKKLSLEEVLQLFLSVLDAVEYAHTQGVIHRDLKPPNILVDREGRPKVLDFGLARALAGREDSFASVTGQVLGTIAYMSPEQVRGKHDQIDARTDVYALGMILFEICTGTSPYPTDSEIVEVLHHITQTPPTSPGKAWNSETGLLLRKPDQRQAPTKCPIDGDVETIILKSITKEVDRRYASAGGLGEDIRRYLDGRPILAKRDNALYVLRRKYKRHRPIIWTVLAALALFAVVMIWMASRSPRQGQVDEEAQAKFLAAQAEFSTVRHELETILTSRAESGESGTDPVSDESLRIIQDAIRELRVALENDPGNQALQDLLLKNYQREIDLMRKKCELPASGRASAGSAG